MGRRLLLDTTEIIDWDRADQRPDYLVSADSVAISAITLTEVLAGPRILPAGPAGYARVRDWLGRSGISILTYGPNTARFHAALLVYSRSVGRPRGPHDLIIAAHAVETGRLLVSKDARARFGDLPGVKIL